MVEFKLVLGAKDGKSYQKELKELNEGTKKGFIKIRDLLLELANAMLAR